MGRDRRPAGVLVLTAVCLAIAAAVAIAGSPGPSGQTACSYVAKHRALFVRIDNPEGTEIPFGDASLSRRGDALKVRDNSPLYPHRVACEGRRPTVHNTDSIVVGTDDKNPFFDLDLRDGLLAPGAAVERDRSSEIEVLLSLGEFAIVNVFLPRSDDRVSMGTLSSSGGVGVNLSGNEASPDVDIVIYSDQAPIVSGGRGDDILAAWGGSEFVAAVPKLAFFDGGFGDDWLVGSDGTDYLNGGHGRDRLDSGAGRDLVDARDRDLDRGTCGAGLDVLIVKQRERLRGCERVVRPEPDSLSARQRLERERMQHR